MTRGRENCVSYRIVNAGEYSKQANKTLDNMRKGARN
jgi:hypothetical protein